mmetsp:Transcript_34882/g.104348  ORF Transcript_34882/g.104348 Transcript_34882/m.104348 type:complete len:217 (-) Transcript_34882:1544-2194(-)
MRNFSLAPAPVNSKLGARQPRTVPMQRGPSRGSRAEHARQPDSAASVPEGRRTPASHQQRLQRARGAVPREEVALLLLEALADANRCVGEGDGLGLLAEGRPRGQRQGRRAPGRALVWVASCGEVGPITPHGSAQAPLAVARQLEGVSKHKGDLSTVKGAHERHRPVGLVDTEDGRGREVVPPGRIALLPCRTEQLARAAEDGVVACRAHRGHPEG